MTSFKVAFPVLAKALKSILFLARHKRDTEWRFSSVIGSGHMLFLGGRWSSDLQSDRSLTPPLTVMAVELSGDTGAAIQSYIHVQSARGNTHPVTIIMTEVLRHIFGSGADVPPVFSLIGLGCLKSLSFLTTSALWGTKQFSASLPLTFCRPSGELVPYVRDITPSEFRWLLTVWCIYAS